MSLIIILWIWYPVWEAHLLIITSTNKHIFLSNTKTSDDRLDKIRDKYKNHPKITYINKHMTNFEVSFTFQTVTKN